MRETGTCPVCNSRINSTLIHVDEQIDEAYFAYYCPNCDWEDSDFNI